MINERTPEELHAAVQTAVPEPGIKETEVRTLLVTAAGFSEGPIGYFSQMAAEMMNAVLSKQHTYHETINDFEFARRLSRALQP